MSGYTLNKWLPVCYAIFFLSEEWRSFMCGVWGWDYYLSAIVIPFLISFIIHKHFMAIKHVLYVRLCGVAVLPVDVG